jgi:hypothetical protein
VIKCVECRYYEPPQGGPPTCHIKLPEWTPRVWQQAVSLDGGCDLGRRPEGRPRKTEIEA